VRLFGQRLSQAVGIAVLETEVPTDGCWYVTAELIVNGRRLSAVDYGPLDLAQVWASCIRPGRYFIWTCDCGFPGCAGRFEGVRVAHRDGLVEWYDVDDGKRYCFPLHELLMALAGAWRRGQELVTLPGRVPCPEVNGSFFSQPEPT
jgi:hypothetical protein